MPNPLLIANRFLVKLAAFAVFATALLIVPVQPAGSTPNTQRTVFDHIGSQTASQYYSPTLNQPSDYTSPVDFSQGRVYVRLEVLDKPSDAAMIPQLCFWRHTENVKYKYETCAITRKFAFSEEGVVWIDAGTPSEWYKKNGVWDWSVPASLGRIMLKDPVSGKLWLTSRCGAACYRGNDIDQHMPVRLDAEVIFVGEGSTLKPPASWRGECPRAWSASCGSSTPTGPGTDDPVDEDPSPPADDPVAEEQPTPPSDPSLPGFDGSEYVTTAQSLRTPTVTAVVGESAILTTWTSVAGAHEYQFRWEPVGDVRHWDQATTTRSRILTGVDSTTATIVSARARVGGKWRPWTTVTVPGFDVADGDTNPIEEPPPAGPSPAEESDPPATIGPEPRSAEVVTKLGNRKTTPTVTVTQLDGALSVTWEPLPKTPSYQIKYRSPGQKALWAPPSSDLSTMLTELQNGTKYTIFVRAYANGAWRPWTKAAASPTAAAGSDVEPAPSELDDEPAPGPGDDGSEQGVDHGNPRVTGGWVKVGDESAVFPNDRSRTRYAFLDPADNPDPTWGASRIGFMVECGALGHAQIDPIVNPGAPQSAHVHEFFGNPNVTPNASTQALIDVPNSEIDCTDRNDKSAYWSPSVYQDGERVDAVLFKAYYKSTTSDVVSMPLGLRMIAGNAGATKNQSRRVGGWVGSGKHNDINTFGKSKMIEINDPSINVTLRVNFPNCWDGEHLDSPDHKSHMAYFNEKTLSCPASHPVRVPQLTTFTQYPASGGDGLSLASGEWYTFHQDFWNGWSPDQMSDLTNECVVAGMNCRVRATPKLQALGQHYEFVPG